VRKSALNNLIDILRASHQDFQCML